MRLVSAWRTVRESTRRRAGRWINLTLRPFGIRLIPHPPPRFDPSAFFVPAPTCQIPPLGFLYELFFGRDRRGIFVEVGAFDGYEYSNTSCLIDRGWSGILIEPVPEFAEQCRARYANNSSVEVLETAVGAENGTISLTVAGALTSANLRLMNEYRQIPWAQASFGLNDVISVKQTTLDEILDTKHIPVSFDLLVVDVEGFETEVFKGFTLSRWRPLMMIVELSNVNPDVTVTRRSDAKLSREICSVGYEVAFKNGTNTVFVSEELMRATIG